MPKELTNLIVKLKSEGVLKTEEIVRALSAIDRRDFVLPHDKNSDAAYRDVPLKILGGQTISQPYTVVFMLELLEPKPGNKILDVGSGSGWTTALLAHIVGERGHVFGVERIPELVELGIKNLLKYPHLTADIAIGDGQFGLPHLAPFERILVSAVADAVPGELVKQLSPEGILVMPVQNALVKIVKTREGVSEERHEGFMFVPLV